MQYQKPRRSISYEALWLFFGGVLIGVAVVHIRDVVAFSGPQTVSYSASLFRAATYAEQPIAREDANLYSEPPRRGSRQPATGDSDKTLGRVLVNEYCGENDRALNCYETCAKEAMECDVTAMQKINSKEAVTDAVQKAGHTCLKTTPINWAGAWDGPWLFARECGYNENEDWAPSCDLQPACGFMRICPCKSSEAPSKGATQTLQLLPALAQSFFSSSPTQVQQNTEKSFISTFFSSSPTQAQKRVAPIAVKYVRADRCIGDEPMSASCDETCEKIGYQCDAESMQLIDSESAMRKVTKNLSIRCNSFLPIHHAGAWDGPWVTGYRCAFNAHPQWEPTCDLKPACGFERICTCRGNNPTNGGIQNSRPAAPQKTTIPDAPEVSWQYDGTVVVNADCGEDSRGLHCKDVCAKEGLTCDVEALKTLNTGRAVRSAAESVGLQCEKTTKVSHIGIWDGPLMFGGDCSFNANPRWQPRCEVKPQCGYARLCTCRGKPATLTGSLPDYITGGPLWPAGAASDYPWERAKGMMYKVPERMSGLRETIYSSHRSPDRGACGSPCVAHCTAGQPRDMIATPGMVKAIKYRLIERMSKNGISLAVLVGSGMMNNGGKEGDVNYARASIGGVPDGVIEPIFKMLAVDRGLVLRERCTTMPCLRKAAGFACNARELGISNFVNRSGYINNICDVQFRRFQTCVNLVREYENDNKIQVDWVTRQRPDVYWVRPAGLAASMSADAVYMHSWATCGYGGADWFYMAPRKFADVIARFSDEMQCNKMKHPKILPHPCKTCLGCECMIHAWLIDNKVPVKVMPFNDNAPGKFCAGNCPNDWVVTERNINMR